MYEQLQQLKQQVLELTNIVNKIQSSQDMQLKGTLDDVQVERVINTITTGDPTTNTLLKDITVSVSVPYSIVLTGNPQTITGTLTGTGTIQVLDFPERLKIDTWKGQRLVIPVYDASKILYK